MGLLGCGGPVAVVDGRSGAIAQRCFRVGCICAHQAAILTGGVLKAASVVWLQQWSASWWIGRGQLGGQTSRFALPS